ncbi:hypothetical protein [Litoreibacter janthinus]|uniref:Uncharacterized protein n=1 Tax=Litoreibacter janthinus TaxID=670154 RepID=A0A1I6G4Z0_9RHOB|nr:hypothetical protein [Litoreibacter janthinus]SFR37273.1 hypothetical protein SAMN04488002_0910 [Litoreibacter janthinus]
MKSEANDQSKNAALTALLQKLGMTMLGANEVLAARMVSDPKDRTTLASIVDTGTSPSGAATGKRQHKPFTLASPDGVPDATNKMSVFGLQQLAQAKTITNRVDRKFIAALIGRDAASAPVARYYLENAWPTK